MRSSGTSSLINNIAYADDLTILAGSKIEARLLLTIAANFLRFHGLSFNSTKFLSIQNDSITRGIYADLTWFHEGTNDTQITNRQGPDEPLNSLDVFKI